MDKPLVSIIIPVYNSEAYVISTIESVLNQVYKNWELIIVNDGSNDKSLSLIQNYCSDRIKIFTQQNKGASAARNYGLANSRGKYIQFLDSDDILSKDKLANQIMLLNNSYDKIAVCSTVHFVDGENHLYNTPNPYEESFLIENDNPVDFLIKLWGGYDGNASMIQTNAWLIPKSVIEKSGQWDESLSLDDDGEFMCRVLLNSKGIIIDRKSRNYYRKFNKRKSLSNNLNNKGLLSQYNSTISKKNELLNKTKSIYAKKAIANQFLNLAVISFLVDNNIYKRSLNELNDLKVKTNFNFKMGGSFIEIIKIIFGWRIAKLLVAAKRKIQTSL